MLRDGEHGRIVAAGDVGGLAAAFLGLAADPEAWRAMGAAGRRRAVEEFTVAAHVDRMERLFRECVEWR
jgi:glycosyltransferase involved in cell wall biosynthesis